MEKITILKRIPKYAVGNRGVRPTLSIYIDRARSKCVFRFNRALVNLMNLKLEDMIGFGIGEGGSIYLYKTPTDGYTIRSQGPSMDLQIISVELYAHLLENGFVLDKKSIKYIIDKTPITNKYFVDGYKGDRV